jgi:enoyl-CoA hydratase/carnithine racemase
MADYMLAIFRTSPPTKENRRHGLTQFLVDMKTPGITVNPIEQISGLKEFNEVVFKDVFLPDDHALGEIDGAWKQATSELAYERSGPERFLETYYVLTELVRALGANPDTRGAEGVGRLVAQLHTMRRMSVSVAGMLQAGKEPVSKHRSSRTSARSGSSSCRIACATSPPLSTSIVQSSDTGRPARIRHQDRTETHDSGRHHRGPARHHRTRSWPALTTNIKRGTFMSGFADIGVEKHGHVTLIEIRRPPLNFFDLSLIRQIADALGEIDKDMDARGCARVTRQGVLRWRQLQPPSRISGDAASGDGTTGDLYREAVRIFSNKKPIVAAVQGAAIGGGLGLAVSADFRVTCPEARFAANFTRLGFHPGFGLTVTLPELIGKNNAALMFYTSRRVTGEEAHKMGLANVLVPQDQVRAEAFKLANEIAENSPLGLMSTRATLRAGLADRVKAQTDHELAEQTWLRETEDHKEGIKATEERRAGQLQGR